VFNRVPREVIRWAMRKLDVDEWLLSAVMSMYVAVQTVVRTAHNNSDNFEVKVCMHQGLALSRLLFVTDGGLCPESLEMPRHGSCYMRMIWLW